MARGLEMRGGDEARIDLAREPDFMLGALTIRPSSCEVVGPLPIARLQPRIMQVLTVLAQAEGATVARAELIERCWNGLAVGEDALNRCIARLRRLSEVDAPGSFVIETLPRVGYRLLRAHAAFEVGPAHSLQVEAILAPPSSDPGHPVAVADPKRLVRPDPRRRFRMRTLGAAGLALVALAALGVGALTFGLRRGVAVRNQRVVLAPFDSVGSESAATRLASGVPDSVASALIAADFKPIAIASNASPPPQGWGEAALRLGGTLLVNGRAETAAGALHASVALSSLPDQTVLWSRDFTRAASAGQALKVQIAGKIADVLHCALDAGNFRDGRYDRQTFALFLSACDLMHDDDRRDRVADILRQVLVREPRFPRALAMLAIADALAVLPPAQAETAHREARVLAAASLKADPADGTAYNALHDLETGPDAYIRRFQWLQKGLAISPNEAGLNNRMAELLMQTGFLDEAVVYAQRSVNLDRLAPPKAETLALAVMFDGQIHEARRLLDQDAVLWPDVTDFVTFRVGMEARTGDPASALAMMTDPAVRAAFGEAPQIDDFRRVALTREAHDPATIARFVAHVSHHVREGGLLPGRAVLMLASVGAVDAAYAAAAKVPEADLGGLVFRPETRVLRTDPRFMSLTARAGLIAFWRWRRTWPDFCGDPDLHYRCAAEAAKL